MLCRYCLRHNTSWPLLTLSNAWNLRGVSLLQRRGLDSCSCTDFEKSAHIVIDNFLTTSNYLRLSWRWLCDSQVVAGFITSMIILRVTTVSVIEAVRTHSLLIVFRCNISLFELYGKISFVLTGCTTRLLRFFWLLIENKLFYLRIKVKIV